VASGEIVDMSQTRLPGFAPTATPSSPKRTASTSGVSETIVTTMSASVAASAGVAARFAPADARDSSFARVRLCTVTSKPARSRFRAIGAPIVPSPMKPIFIVVLDAPSPADFENRPGDVVGFGTNQERHRLRHVFGRSDPSDGCVLDM